MVEFKKLSDVEVVAEPAESANVLIEEDGVIKKAPKTAVGGAGGVTSWNDLTDKPFGEECRIIHQGTYTLKYQENPISYSYEYSAYIETLSLENGKEYISTVNGVSKKSTSIQGDLSISGGRYSSGEIKIFPTEEHAELGYPDITVDFTVQENQVIPLDAKYLPKADAVLDATSSSNVSATKFNELLTALRNAGYLAI